MAALQQPQAKRERSTVEVMGGLRRPASRSVAYRSTPGQSTLATLSGRQLIVVRSSAEQRGGSVEVRRRQAAHGAADSAAALGGEKVPGKETRVDLRRQKPRPPGVLDVLWVGGAAHGAAAHGVHSAAPAVGGAALRVGGTRATSLGVAAAAFGGGCADCERLALQPSAGLGPNKWTWPVRHRQLKAQACWGKEAARVCMRAW